MKNIIDISNFTTIHDVNALARYDGVLIMGTQGGDFVSPTLSSDVSLCRQAKVPYGIYHVAGHIHTALEEYTFYKKILSQYSDRSLRDCLDVEDEKNSTIWIHQFLSYDTNMMFYANRSVSDFSKIDKQKTWLAYPQNNIPNELNGYLGIQYFLDTNVNGIDNCDISLFNNEVLTPMYNIKEVSTMTILKPGIKSASVRMLQSILNVCLGLTLTVDGYYGINTFKAVEKYQQIMKLSVDGEFGEQTRTCLLNDLLTSWFK